MAFNLGFPPHAAPQQHIFVSFNRQNPSEAAPIAAQLSQRVPVWYDDGTAVTDEGQDEVTRQLASSRAAVFFADSGLFAREDIDMCNELTLAKIYSIPCICVWCSDLSGVNPKQLPDGLRNLRLDFKNMPSVNAYEKANAADTVADVLSAAGIPELLPLPETDLGDFEKNVAPASSEQTDDIFGVWETDFPDDTEATVMSAYDENANRESATPFPPLSAKTAKRRRGPLFRLLVILAAAAILCLLLAICAKIGHFDGFSVSYLLR